MLGSIGCGPDYKAYPVSGTIKLDGKPLANAMILTQPVGSEEDVTPGPGSFGETDSEGRFTLVMQHEDIDGAVSGKALVKIQEIGEKKAANDDSVDSSILRSKVPLDYVEMKVEIDIPEGGTDSLDFDLKGERPKRR